MVTIIMLQWFSRVQNTTQHRQTKPIMIAIIVFVFTIVLDSVVDNVFLCHERRGKCKNQKKYVLNESF